MSAGMVTAATLMSELLQDLARRNPPTFDTLWDAEISARTAFHHNPTPATLTAWVDAKEALENEA